MDKMLFIIAGCNGAGKTTSAFKLLPELLNCYEFVNADEIARALSPFRPESVALEAGRIMLTRIDQLLTSGSSFAIETTLALKTYVSLIKRAQAMGYTVVLTYVWLNSPEEAIKRVAARVSKGGHHIPEEDIRRRYLRSMENLMNLYIPISNYWYLCDNSHAQMELAAEGILNEPQTIYNQEIWNEFIRLKKCN